MEPEPPIWFESKFNYQKYFNIGYFLSKSWSILYFSISD